MFLESIHILNVDLCVQQPGKYIAQTRASTDLCAILPYLNAVIDRADYNANADSIKFYRDKVEFTLIKDQINVAKFINRTELLELLDWLSDLINDIHESMSEITPDYATRPRMPTLRIYSLLPKTNCRRCGESSCMAFAVKLFTMERLPSDCPVLGEPPFEQAFRKLESEL